MEHHHDEQIPQQGSSRGKRTSHGNSIAAAPGFTASAAAASPVGSPSSAQTVASTDTNTTRVKEIVQASDNHDGVKGWVYNKSSHTMIVHIGSHYHPDTESFILKPGEDFTYVRSLPQPAISEEG